MKISIRIFASISIGVTFFLFYGCTSKGKRIIEPRFGTYHFNTYTVDTFRFRIILNDEVLTDSLLSPISEFTREVNFFDNTARLLILDAGNHNQVVLDSVIQTKIGTTRISIVQFQHEEKPDMPPLTGEPPPAAGSYKVRFQYVKPSNPAVNFVDSVRCIVQRDDIPIDTVALSRYGLTPFYEGKTNINRFNLKLQYISGQQLSSNIIQRLGLEYTGFNTTIVYGTETTTNPNRFEFKLDFAYSRE